MPQIIIPAFSIALNILGLIVVLILLVSCLSDRLQKREVSRSFMLLLAFTMFTLVLEIIGCIGEGRLALASMTFIAKTLAACTCCLAILCFLGYLRESSFTGNVGITLLYAFLSLLCFVCIVFFISDIFFHYAYTIDPSGYYVPNNPVAVIALSASFPLLSFLVVLLIAALSKRIHPARRIFFIVCALFPTAGVIADYLFHGLSLAYTGFVLSVLMIYTGIYRQKQRVIDSQRNALMLSQINPHFTYNTLSAIAALCDISPAQAKSLTLEFSRYLRHNLTTLSSEELIPFAREMDHVDCYLKIEKARFREKLNVAYSIKCKDFNVPPLTIQPIVENAVRHGITKKAGGGTVHIAAFHTPKYYVVEVRDDGVGFDPDAPHADDRVHVGLENVRSRVKQMCRGDVQVKSIPGVGTRVIIIIPKKNNRKGGAA